MPTNVHAFILKWSQVALTERSASQQHLLTQDAASRFAAIAQTMRERGLNAHDVAQFLDRVVFALFAEDVNLLPEKIFTRLVKNSDDRPEVFARLVRELFQAMSHGGFWDVEIIRHFNGRQLLAQHHCSYCLVRIAPFPESMT
jgi:restriction-modification enzyme MmeI-like protein